MESVFSLSLSLVRASFLLRGHRRRHETHCVVYGNVRLSFVRSLSSSSSSLYSRLYIGKRDDTLSFTIEHRRSRIKRVEA